MSIWSQLFRNKKKLKNTSARSGESGNVFLMLFGAVAMVGVIGASTMTIMKGPVKTMSQVTKRTVAENNMIATARLAVIAASQAGSDCDADGTVEPDEHTGAIAGFTGGGGIPVSIGVNRMDPWGNDYGYCVWDHGTIDDIGCGGGAQNRLAGDGVNPTITDYVVAIISAGPDGNYDSTCQDYTGAGTQLTKVGDDLVFGYTYDEAATIAGGLWSEEGADTARIGRDLSVRTDINDPMTETLGFAANTGDFAVTGSGRFPSVSTDNIQAIGGGPIDVLDDVDVTGGVTASGDISANELTAGSDANIGGDLDVTGASNLGILTAGATTSTDLDVSGTLDVTGVSTLGVLNSGASTLDSLGVTNNTTIGGTLAAGASTFDSLGVTNGATIGTTLGVGGTTTTNTLAVTTGGANITGGVTIATGGLGITSGGASISGNLDMTGGRIINIPDVPVAMTDAVNANYVSGAIGGIAETDPQVGDVTTAGNLCVSDGDSVECTQDPVALVAANEDDPEVNTLTSGRWCTTDGSVINCTALDPTGVGLLWTDNTTHITREAFHVIDSGQTSTTASLDGDGTRAFFDPDTGSFRGGAITGGDDAWQAVNIGSNSFAWGENTQASGNYSFAGGATTTASGPNSFAIGEANTASANNSSALGFNSEASGYTSLSFGRDVRAGTGVAQMNDATADVGNYSVAFGLGNASTATLPQVSGNEAFAIFFGDQQGEDITATNVLALEGGSLLLSNDSGTACAAEKQGALRLNAAGDALEICDFAGSGDWTDLTAVAAGAGDRLQDTDGDTSIDVDINNDGSPDDIVFTNDGGESMRIDAAGNVGIGTNLPDTKLVVQDTGLTVIKVVSEDDQSRFVSESYNNTAGLGTVFRSVRSRGDITTPLAIQDNDTIASFNGAVYNGTQSEAAARIALSVDGTNVTGAGNHPGGKIEFRTRGTTDTGQFGVTTQMTIRNDGTVGIGDTTPDASLLLDVEGQVGATEYCDEDGLNCFDYTDLGVPGPDTLDWDDFIDAMTLDATTTIDMDTNTADLNFDANTFVIDSSADRIGIGTNTPGATLDVTGTTTVSGLTTLNDDLVVDTNTLFVDASADQVGIGDLTPDATLLLDVEGQVGATEYCDEDGLNCFDYTDLGVPGPDTLDWDDFIDAMTLDATTTIDMDTNTADLNFDANTFVIDSSADRIGIGTANPDALMHLYNNTPATPLNLIIENDADETGILVFDSNRTVADDTIGRTAGLWDGEQVADIILKAGADTANKDEGWLLFRTRTDGDIAPEPRMVIREAGAVGIGDTTPDASLLLDVEGQVGATEYCDEDGLNCFDYTDLGVPGPDTLDWDDFIDAMTLDATTTIDMDTNTADLNFDANTFVIDSSADRIGIGTASPGSKIEIFAPAGVGGRQSNIAMIAVEDIPNLKPTIEMAKQRDTGGYLSADDGIGALVWRAYNGANLGGSELGRNAASIAIQADGNHAFDDTPARIIFSTTPAGVAAPSEERMRITSAGDLVIGDTAPSLTLMLDVAGQVGATEYCDEDGLNCYDITSLGGTSDRIQDTNNNTFIDVDTTDNGLTDTIVFNNNGAESMRITSAGDLLLGATSPVSNEKLLIAQAFTETSGTLAGQISFGAVTPTGASTANNISSYSLIEVPNTNIFNIDTVQAQFSLTTIDGSGDVTNAFSSSGLTQHSGSGNISALNGLYTGVMIDNGGTADEAISMAAISNFNSGTVTDSFGLTVSSDTTGATVTNRYGVYIDAPIGPATNDFGFAQNGAALTNFMQGSLLLSNTSSTCAALHEGALRLNATDDGLEMCDGAGTWNALTAAASIADDSLDWDKFVDAMTLDASTVIDMDTNAATLIFDDDDNTLTIDSVNNRIGIGLNNPASALHLYDDKPDITISGINNTAANDAPNVGISRSRAGGIINDNDKLGSFRFFGNGGVAAEKAAVMRAEVDGTPGNDDMPTRLEFHVAADGGVVAEDTDVPEMVIKSTGSVGIGDETPDLTLLLDVEGQVGATEYCDEAGLNCFDHTDVSAGVADDSLDWDKFVDAMTLDATTTIDMDTNAATLIFDDDDDLLVIDSVNNRIGIGIAVPGTKLDIDESFANLNNTVSSVTRIVGYADGAAATNHDLNGMYVFAQHAGVGAGNSATAVSTEARGNNDATQQTALAFYGDIETYDTDIGYGAFIENQDSTGGTAYGLYLNVNDTDTTNYGLYQFGNNVTNVMQGGLLLDNGSSVCGAGEDGAMRLNAAADSLEFCDGAGAWNAISTSGLWTDNTTHISRENLHVLDAGLAAGSTTAGLDGDGIYTFYDPDKGAFRGGEITGGNDAFEDANIGTNSFAWGNGTEASGDASTALGNLTTASNLASIALGNSTISSGSASLAAGILTTASGQSAMAMGTSTTASGVNSFAMGGSATASGFISFAFGSEVQTGTGVAQTNDANPDVGNYSVGFGLGDASTATLPQITANESFGIFFGDQESSTVTDENVLALVGGQLLIDAVDNGTDTEYGCIRYNDTSNELEYANDCDQGSPTYVSFDAPGAIAIDDLTDAATVIADSNIFIGNEGGGSFGADNDRNLGVGYATLDSLTNAGSSGTPGDNNVAFGHDALTAATTGYSNIAIGNDALESLTDGQSNTAVGRQALRDNVTGSSNTAIGRAALQNTTSSNNTAVGWESASSNTTGSENSILGSSALRFNETGIRNVAIGREAGLGVASSSNVSNNVLVGWHSGFSVLTGADENVFIGENSGNAVTTGSQNTLLGQNTAATLTTGSNNIIIGENVDVSAATASNELNIGDLIYGDLANGEVFLGAAKDPAPDGDLSNNQITFWLDDANNEIEFKARDASGDLINSTLGGTVTEIDDLTDAATDYATDFNMFMGDNAGANNPVGAQSNLAIGQNAFDDAGKVATTDNNIAIGQNALTALTDGFGNVAIGTDSLLNETDGDMNTVIGWRAMEEFDGGRANVAVGHDTLAGQPGLSGGDFNTAIGFQAGEDVTTGDNNTLLGHEAGYNLTTGSANILIGTGDSINDDGGIGNTLTTGNNNILIGASTVDASAAGASNELNIGDLIYGDLANNEVFLDAPAAAAPDGDLANGQVTFWVDATNDEIELKAKDSAGDVINVTVGSGGGGGTPAGADTQVQYNNGGAFGAEAAFTYDQAADTLTLTGTLEADTKVTFGQITGAAAPDYPLAGGSSLWTDNTTHITRENFHIMDIGLVSGSTTAGLDGDGTYSFYDPDNGAMRGGVIGGGNDAWQDSNIGSWSFAWGNNAQASGSQGSVAFGSGTTADGQSSFAAGGSSSATGNSSMAVGFATDASGSNSVALGDNTTASGDESVALGDNTTASAQASFAMGAFSNASGTRSTALGVSTDATGDGSMAVGFATEASGYYSYAFGREVRTGTGVAQNDALASDVGNYSVGFGLGDASTATFPQVTANESFGIFFGDQESSTVTDENVLALVGGQLLIDAVDNGTDTEYGCIRYNDTSNELEYANDCDQGSPTYVSFDAPGAIAIDDLTDGYTDYVTDFNLAMGQNAGGSLTTGGQYNTLVGIAAGNAITTGISNTALGRGALMSNVTGTSNTAIGNHALRDNITNSNTAVGSGALAANTTGTLNTAVGDSALVDNNGSYNTAFGNSAGLNLNSGNDNTIIGSGTAATLTTGDNNILIGRSVDVPAAATSNYLNIGDLIYGDLTNNEVFLDAPAAPAPNGDLANGQLTFWLDDTNDEIELKARDASGDLINVTVGPGGGLWTDNTTHITRETFHVIDAGEDSTSAGLDIDGKYSFYQSFKSAFRGGEITGGNDAWQDTNVGEASFAFGRNTEASGSRSTAFGEDTTASGPRSMAFGDNTVADGSRSVAFGDNTSATGAESLAFGVNTTASQSRATAFGDNADASGSESTAFGRNTTASASRATAFGFGSTASGNESTAFGLNTTASGDRTLALGDNSTASGALSAALGDTVIASGYNSFGFGRKITVGTGVAQVSDGNSDVGNYSVGWGLGNSGGTAPAVTADQAFGIFFGNQDSSTVTDENVLALKGGMLLIDAVDGGSDTEYGCIRYEDTLNQLQWSNDCDQGSPSWTAMGSAPGLAIDDLTDATTDYVTDLNLFMGDNAGANTPVGAQNNLAIGQNAFDDAGKTNAADGNLAIGYNSLSALTTGSDNVALGPNTGENLSTNSYQNTFIGAGAGQGTGEVGYHNVAIGNLAGANEMGFGSVAIGNGALGSFDPPGGFATTQVNVAIGLQAFTLANDGGGNVVIGGDAAGSFATGGRQGSFEDNVFMGDRVGTALDASGVTIERNTFLGSQAGSTAVTGDNNILIGYNAQKSTTTASDELNIGDLIYGDLANNEVFLDAPAAAAPDGDLANGQVTFWVDATNDEIELKAKDSAGDVINVTVGGGGAIDDLSDGITDYTTDFNMFMGDNAGANTPAGAANNLAIGQNAFDDVGKTATADDNTMVGYETGTDITEGSSNSLFGNRAGSSITTGSNNSFFGDLAGVNTTVGDTNTFIGQIAGRENVAKERNTAVGFGAMLYADSTGTNSNGHNTAIGYHALRGSTTAANNTGTNNTALGTRTLTENESGSNNIAIGFQTGDTTTTGSDNILIGYDVDASAAGASDELNIGNLIYGDLANNEVFLDAPAAAAPDGDLANGQVTFWVDATNDEIELKAKDSAGDVINVTVGGGSGLWTSGAGDDIYYDTGTTPQVGINMTNPSVELDVTGDIEYTGTITDVSDRRLKENINKLESTVMLDRLMNVDGYTFQMIDREERNKDRVEFGVIAQEIEAIFPELVHTDNSTEEAYKSVNYVGLITPIIEAVKELYSKVLEIADQVKVIFDKIAQLESKNAQLQAEVDSLKQQNEDILKRLESIEANVSNDNNKEASLELDRQASGT